MRIARHSSWWQAVWLAAAALVVQTGLGHDGIPADHLANQVKLLSSTEFLVRQRAEKELEAAGTAAIPLLARAARSPDDEVRERALRILLGHAMSSQVERRDPARAALEGGAGAKDRAGQAARRALIKIREITAAHAVAELTRLGARVSPVENTTPLQYEVQIGQAWAGGDNHLARLVDLEYVRTIVMDNSPVSDAGLVHLGKLPSVTKLWLGNSQLTGRTLPQLAPLVQLEILSLKDLPIDDERLRTLPKLPSLQHLTLDGTRITNQGMTHLTQYPLLNTLYLERTLISDGGLAPLRPLSNLRKLHLGGTRVGDRDLAELAHFPALTTLSLRGVKLRAEGLKHLSHLPQLEWLSLEESNVTDEQLADLTGLPRLRSLWLTRTEVSDQGIEALKGLKDLEDIHLQGSQVSSEGVEELRRALPNCRVEK